MEQSDYTKCVKVYFDFHKEQAGVEPMFTIVEGKKMKEIIKYLQRVSIQPPECTLGYIFKHWHLLSDFHQRNLKLSQIHSEMGNIIAAIKNNRKNKNQSYIEQKLEKLKNGLHTNDNQ